MKSVIISSLCIGAVLFALAAQTEMNKAAGDAQELEEGLSVCVSQALKEVMEKEHFGIEDRNEFIAAFLQALVLKTSSDTDMTVSVISADMEKGLLDIEVRECLSEIAVRRTVIFERDA